MLPICPCMVIYRSDGSEMCRRCYSDIYGCDCPLEHTRRCEYRETS